MLVPLNILGDSTPQMSSIGHIPTFSGQKIGPLTSHFAKASTVRFVVTAWRETSAELQRSRLFLSACLLAPDTPRGRDASLSALCTDLTDL